MELMIKYRNDRKAEGAKMSELSLYDDRIYSMLTSTNNTNTLDIELLIYRRQMKEEGASDVIISYIDKHIHATLTKTPIRTIDTVDLTKSFTKLQPSPISLRNIIQNKTSRTSSNPSYIILSGPSRVFIGQYFTVEAMGDWENAGGAIWTLNDVPNCGCKNPGCGFYAPNSPGVAKIKYILNGLVGTLDIQVIDKLTNLKSQSPTPPPPSLSPTPPPPSLTSSNNISLPSSPAPPPLPLSPSKNYINLNVTDDDDIIWALQYNN